ncbi:MAG: MBL fold metallo-hydrolase, partial [Pseudomonadota bacterium]|nr:MBL fold metallo-hydrolase [Pseudomonadota bacterium]
MPLNFDLDFDPAYGEPVTVFPGVARVTAKNPGPFTFHGTNSYLVGSHDLAVIDPGPESDEHFDALVGAIAGRPVTHILVSHTHRDHSPLAAKLSEATGARVYAEGPHRPARKLSTGAPLDNGADAAFIPDIALADGDLLAGDGWTLRTVLTPGHTANHAAFALEGAGLLFSADHVMAWSTTIVAPPDGSMADYMASLDRLIQRGDRQLLPGHGGPVTNPNDYLRALREHRLARESAILERLRR